MTPLRSLRIYLLSNGHYIESDHSPNFPNIPLTQIIAATVKRAWQLEIVQALEEFEGAIKVVFDREYVSVDRRRYSFC
ncbi:hypothetical protein [Nostoc sp. CALU 546]|uniref:hypothetical protein n=1 Tax=Nostoc sp. CALU 546 TaxID=1867241 RepID=UPI003B67572B